METRTIRERVLAYLCQHPEGVDDDELARALDLNARQQANAICRKLEQQGQVLRRKVEGKIHNFVCESDSTALQSSRAKPEPTAELLAESDSDASVSRLTTARERILAYLHQRPEGVDDDELAHVLNLSARQHANRICRQLEAKGQVQRRKVGGKIHNFASASAVDHWQPFSPGLDSGLTLQSGRYRMLRSLGEGGMGAAHLVEDQRLHRNCVIKEILIPDTIRREQFSHEAQLLADLRHPHLPVVYDYFQEGMRPYLVMEYVEGQTLDRLRDTRTTPFEFHDVLKWARELLDALDYIHTRHPAIIHRDIKPQNVCITPQGNAMLLDFGIARRLDDTHTQTAARAFTQGYAPIEQYPLENLRHTESPRRYVEALHAADIHTGPYSDIYSLGATLYYAFTLMPPPDACMRVLDDELRPVHEINPATPEFLDAAIMRALALDPRQRFQSAAEMLGALQPQPEAVAPRLGARGVRPLPASNVMALEQLLLYIPTGHFEMGSDDTQLKDACRPQHWVNLSAYCIGRYPVTHADYQRYIEANPSALAPYSPLRSAQRYNWDRRTRTYPRGLDDHPVVLVTWEEARAYCRWLSDVTGYRCRLPYETEWEKAACWDASVGHARVYPWGDTFDENRCNVDAHGALQLISSAVGSYSPAGDSPYGLADMAGNVWEWTGSLYHHYPYSAVDGREDPEATGERTIRGGAYDEGPLAARSAWRAGAKPDSRLPSIGFRVVCEAKDR